MRLIRFLLVALLVTGCVGVQLKSPADMAPKEKALLLVQLYMNADTNYRAQFAAAEKPLSEDMKKYFREYKAVLEQVAPAIELYVITVRAGGLPSEEQEQITLDAIYQLQTIILKLQR